MFLFLVSFVVFGQANMDQSVLLTAVPNANENAITLQWPQLNNATNIFIDQKLNSTGQWSNLSTINGTVSTAILNNINLDQIYEFRLRGTLVNAFGYIETGIAISPEHSMGKILVLIDLNYEIPLETELTQLMQDLKEEGWIVQFEYVDRDDTVANVKALIVNQYALDNRINTLYLVGHIPVPYSGNIFPDGHPDHQGAWGSDGYYGDLNGDWTDITVNNIVANRVANHNIPDDGKFDQSYFPSDIELMVGRIDFFDLPAFVDSDTMLTKQYLAKNRAYRRGEMTIQQKALIDDNFQSFDIAISGWRNFASLIGQNISDNVNDGIDYRTEMLNENYYWSCGAGAGSYSSCANVINASQFAQDSIQGIFTMLAGSYFGDYDSQNNLLRSAIANKGTLLTSCWGGIPSWAVHPMGMGRTIGHCTRLSQNKVNNDYNGSFNGSSNMIHIALMGDPTLKMFPLTPPENVTYVLEDENIVALAWDEDNVADMYFVYRVDPVTQDYIPLHEEALTTPFFNYEYSFAFQHEFVVRKVELKTSPSGSFYNLGAGSSIIIDDALDPVNPIIDNLNVQNILVCEEDLEGSFTLANFGSEPISSFFLEISLDGIAVDTVSFIGTFVETGSIQLFNFDMSVPVFGSHDIQVRIILTNGDDIIETENSTSSDSFSINAGGLVSFNIQTDFAPFETEIHILSEEGQILSTLANLPGNTLISGEICIVEGCYQFEILDEAGNGICCDNGLGFVELILDGTVIGYEDEFGEEALIDFCIEYTPPSIDAEVSTEIFLQGYYNETTMIMNSFYVANDLLPKEQPFGDYPYNYDGTESFDEFPVNGVDWVLLELRDKDDPTIVIDRSAVLLLDQGEVLNVNGGNGGIFNVEIDSYYMAVQTRSHLDVMSAEPIYISGDVFYSFASSVESAMGTDQLILLDQFEEVTVLWAGDFDGNGVINNVDFNLWQSQPAAVNQYLTWDGDGSSVVNVGDYNLWFANRSKVGNPNFQN